MVFAVQCPNPQCRKYMLVEERDRTNEIICLLCKTPFQVQSDRPLSMNHPVPESENTEKA
jgi:hypothetical protein